MAEGEGGYDPCECIYSHEAAMDRLLNLLRNTQTTCTDTECFTDGQPGPQGALPGGDGWGDSSWIFLIMWAVLALSLFFLRPSSLRRSEPEKPARGGGGDPNGDNQPPPPGPSVQ